MCLTHKRVILLGKVSTVIRVIKGLAMFICTMSDNFFTVKEL